MSFEERKRAKDQILAAAEISQETVRLAGRAALTRKTAAPEPAARTCYGRVFQNGAWPALNKK